MYKREARNILLELAKYYPVITITGPRQSGKTTLSKTVFNNKKYVSLEDLDQREFAEKDPRSFLAQDPNGMIIDEAQNCPQLFSYIQGIVDEKKIPAQFVLTGSQQFDLISGITQSLAGRVGIVELLPFSLTEIQDALTTVDDILLKGFYPPIYDKMIPAKIWQEDYIRTYIERDVRKLVSIQDLSLFQKFLGLCAARVGQLVNFAELSNATGIDVKTVKSWLSVLEASYIIFLLQPHYKNFSKKLVKSPKLYFYDVGLLSYLLRIRPEEIALSSYRGHIFESMIVSELYKFNKNYRKGFHFYFWRDSKGVEIDVIFENGSSINAIEIKSGATINEDFFDNLKLYKKYAGPDLAKSYLVYGANEKQKRSEVEVLPWNRTCEIIENI